MSKKMKNAESTKPAGESKYARKCAARAKLAARLGMPDTPALLLWAESLAQAEAYLDGIMQENDAPEQ